MLDKKLMGGDLNGVKRLGGRGNLIAGAVAYPCPASSIIGSAPLACDDILNVPERGRGIATIRGRTMKTFINMLRDDRGASAAEYALILAIIGAVIALAALTLSQSIGNAMNSTAECIETPTTGTC